MEHLPDVGLLEEHHREIEHKSGIGTHLRRTGEPDAAGGTTSFHEEIDVEKI